MVTKDMIEILSLIIKGLLNKQSYEEIYENCYKLKNFKDKTFAAAVSLIEDKQAAQKTFDSEFKDKLKSVRILNEEESRIIGLNNYNYLLHLQNLGLINNEDINDVLDYFNEFPFINPTTEIINFLIISSFLDINNFTMPGSRVLLSSNDTIN